MDTYLGKEIVKGWIIRKYGCSYVALYKPLGGGRLADASWSEGRIPKEIQFGDAAWDLGDRRNSRLADAHGAPINDHEDATKAHWVIVCFREVAFGSTDDANAILERVSEEAEVPVRAHYLKWKEVDSELLHLEHEWEETDGKFPTNRRTGPKPFDYDYIHSNGQTEYLTSGLARHVVAGHVTLEEAKEIFEKIFQQLYDARGNINQFPYQESYCGGNLDLLKAAASGHKCFDLGRPNGGWWNIIPGQHLTLSEAVKADTPCRAQFEFGPQKIEPYVNQLLEGLMTIEQFEVELKKL